MKQLAIVMLLVSFVALGSINAQPAKKQVKKVTKTEMTRKVVPHKRFVKVEKKKTVMTHGKKEMKPMTRHEMKPKKASMKKHVMKRHVVKSKTVMKKKEVKRKK